MTGHVWAVLAVCVLLMIILLTYLISEGNQALDDARGLLLHDEPDTEPERPFRPDVEAAIAEALQIGRVEHPTDELARRRAGAR